MRFHSLALAAAAALAFGSAQAASYDYTGDTTGGPTFNRPFTIDSLSAIGTDVAYSTLEFSVTATGSYDFFSAATGFDNFTLLYSPAFEPSAGLSNLLALNDDFGGIGNSGFSHDLTAGTSYVFVTTGYNNSDMGAFANSIAGPGDVITSAVPEPQSYALMALGLAALGLSLRRRRAAND